MLKTAIFASLPFLAVFGVALAGVKWELQRVYWIVSMGVGIFGLAGGMYYFLERIHVDRQRDKEERIRKRITLILEQLEIYSDSFLKVAIDEKLHDADLTLLRLKMDRCIEIVESFIELNEALLKFASSDLATVLKVFRHDDARTEKIIKEMSSADLRNEERSSMRVIGIAQSSRLVEARIVCIKNSEVVASV